MGGVCWGLELWGSGCEDVSSDMAGRVVRRRGAGVGDMRYDLRAGWTEEGRR